MKKLVLICLLCVCAVAGKAQIAPVQDTTQSGSPFTPSFRYQLYNGFRIPYIYNPTLGKYDALLPGNYLRRYYYNRIDSVNRLTKAALKGYADSLNTAQTTRTNATYVKYSDSTQHLFITKAYLLNTVFTQQQINNLLGSLQASLTNEVNARIAGDVATLQRLGLVRDSLKAVTLAEQQARTNADTSLQGQINRVKNTANGGVSINRFTADSASKQQQLNTKFATADTNKLAQKSTLNYVNGIKFNTADTNKLQQKSTSQQQYSTLNTQQQNNSTAISNETTNRQTAVNNEQQRAQAAELANSVGIASAKNQISQDSILIRRNRTLAVQDSINKQVAITNLGNNLASELVNRANADNAIQRRIDTLKGTGVTLSKYRTDSTATRGLINSKLNITDTSSLESKTLANFQHGIITQQLIAETARAQAAEQANAAAILAETTQRKADSVRNANFQTLQTAYNSVTNVTIAGLQTSVAGKLDTATAKNLYQVKGTYTNTFNGRSGAVVPQSGDYGAYYGTLAGQQANSAAIAANATAITTNTTSISTKADNIQNITTIFSSSDFNGAYSTYRIPNGDITLAGDVAVITADARVNGSQDVNTTDVVYARVRIRNGEADSILSKGVLFNHDVISGITYPRKTDASITTIKTGTYAGKMIALCHVINTNIDFPLATDTTGANQHLAIKTSTDGGLTWSAETYLDNLRPAGATNFFDAIGTGITMSTDNSVVIPVQAWFPATTPGTASTNSYAGTIRSTDGGTTWTRSTLLTQTSSESSVVEGTSGQVILNSRTFTSAHAIYTTTDFGQTWTASIANLQSLKDPGSEGATMSVNLNGRKVYLYSGNLSRTTRANTSISFSNDYVIFQPFYQFVNDNATQFGYTALFGNKSFLGALFEHLGPIELHNVTNKLGDITTSNPQYRPGFSAPTTAVTNRTMTVPYNISDYWLPQQVNDGWSIPSKQFNQLWYMQQSYDAPGAGPMALRATPTIGLFFLRRDPVTTTAYSFLGNSMNVVDANGVTKTYHDMVRVDVNNPVTVMQGQQKQNYLVGWYPSARNEPTVLIQADSSISLMPGVQTVFVDIQHSPTNYLKKISNVTNGANIFIEAKDPVNYPLYMQLQGNTETANYTDTASYSASYLLHLGPSRYTQLLAQTGYYPVLNKSGIKAWFHIRDGYAEYMNADAIDPGVQPRQALTISTNQTLVLGKDYNSPGTSGRAYTLPAVTSFTQNNFYITLWKTASATDTLVVPATYNYYVAVGGKNLTYFPANGDGVTAQRVLIYTGDHYKATPFGANTYILENMNPMPSHWTANAVPYYNGSGHASVAGTYGMTFADGTGAFGIQLLNVANNATVGGTLSVTGNTTVGGNATVTGTVSGSRLYQQSSVTGTPGTDNPIGIGAASRGLVELAASSFVYSSRKVAGFPLSSDVTLGTFSPTDATLTFSANYNGSANASAAVSQSFAYNWTGLQTWSQLATMNGGLTVNGTTTINSPSAYITYKRTQASAGIFVQLNPSNGQFTSLWQFGSGLSNTFSLAYGTAGVNLTGFTTGNFTVNGSTDAGYRWDVQGTGRYTGNVTLPHIIGGSTAPTIAAGAGAGTSPTVAIAGTDIGWTATITAGTSPSASDGVIFTVTYSSAYGAAPSVVTCSRAGLQVPSSIYWDQASSTATQAVFRGIVSAGVQYKISSTVIQ